MAASATQGGHNEPDFVTCGSCHLAPDSVVTTIELSPPPRWLATTEPTPPLRCLAVFSAVFQGAVP